MTGVDIHYIAEKLSDKFKISYVESRTCRVKGIRIWNSRDVKSRKDFLYLTDDIAAVQSQRRAVNPAVLIVCLRDSEAPIHSTSWNGRVWYLHTCVPLVEIQDEIQDILEDYDAWYGNCVDLILEGKDIADLLDFAAQKLQNPIALFDVTGILIHQAGTFYKDVEGTLWEEVLNSGFTPVEYVMGTYQVTPLLADHIPGEMCLLYLIEKDGKTLLRAHDTGIFPDATWEYLKGKKIDLVSLDCTFVTHSCRKNHMGLPEAVETRDRLLEMGCATPKSQFVINHFSHNIPVLHRELSKEAAKLGFLTAYDGMQVSV